MDKLLRDTMRIGREMNEAKLDEGASKFAQELFGKQLGELTAEEKEELKQFMQDKRLKDNPPTNPGASYEAKVNESTWHIHIYDDKKGTKEYHATHAVDAESAIANALEQLGYQDAIDMDPSDLKDLGPDSHHGGTAYEYMWNTRLLRIYVDQDAVEPRVEEMKCTACDSEKDMERDDAGVFACPDCGHLRDSSGKTVEAKVNEDKTYFAVDLERHEIEKLKKELEATGLELGKDFLVKSGHESWITYAAHDSAQDEILGKYGVEIEEAKLNEKPEPAEEKEDEDFEFDEFDDEDENLPKKSKPADEEAPEIVKELIGSTEDTFYYMLSVDNDEGEIQDLSIVDQEGVEKYSAKEHGLEVANTPEILFKAIKELEIQELEFSMFDKYLFPYVFEEEEEEEEDDEKDLEDSGLEPIEDEGKGKDDDFKESRKMLESMVDSKSIYTSDRAEYQLIANSDGTYEVHEDGNVIASGRWGGAGSMSAEMADPNDVMNMVFDFFHEQGQEANVESKVTERVEPSDENLAELAADVKAKASGDPIKQTAELMHKLIVEFGLTLDDVEALMPRLKMALKYAWDVPSPRVESKRVMEMKINDHENNVFDVYLSDDGTEDTVIDVSGHEFRFDNEFAALWRDEDGTLSAEGLRELALDALVNLAEDEYNELVARAAEQEETAPVDDAGDIDINVAPGATKPTGAPREAKVENPVRRHCKICKSTMEVKNDDFVCPKCGSKVAVEDYPVDEATMGVDYIKKARDGVKKASAAMKDKDFDTASQVLDDVADDCTDGAKAAKKMKVAAADKVEKDKEKVKTEEPKVEEAQIEEGGYDATDSVKVVRKAETDEWLVKYYEDGKYSEDKTSYHDDKDDAEDTAMFVQQKIQAAQDKLQNEAKIAERETNPHFNPRDLKIVFATPEQEILWDAELSGQVSDGKWENSRPHDHYKDMTAASTTHSPNPEDWGTQGFRPRKSYNFNDKELKDIVGERMLASVKMMLAFPDIDYKVRQAAEYIMNPRYKDRILNPDDAEAGYWRNLFTEIQDALNIEDEVAYDAVLAKIEAVPYSEKDMTRDLKQMSKIIRASYRGETQEGAGREPDRVGESRLTKALRNTNDVDELTGSILEMLN